jgi:hypothetical protein
MGCLRNQSMRKSPSERIFRGVGLPGQKTREIFRSLVISSGFHPLLLSWERFRNADCPQHTCPSACRLVAAMDRCLCDFFTDLQKNAHVHRYKFNATVYEFPAPCSTAAIFKWKFPACAIKSWQAKTPGKAQLSFVNA